MLCYSASQPLWCKGDLYNVCLHTLLPVYSDYRYTMVWAMGSMSAAHIYRMMTDYGGWSLDFTGPLMIIVQKVTLVAFALHDGKSTGPPTP